MKYPKSILTDRLDECFICRTTRNVEVHHVMNGANRKYSTKYGLVVGLCKEHHTGQNGVHKNAIMAKKLKAFAQKKFIEKYDKDLYMQVFKKNYEV